MHVAGPRRIAPEDAADAGRPERLHILPDQRTRFRAVVDEQRAIGQRQADLQRQVWNIFGIALFISLTIAWVASRHALRLEQRLTEQRAREEQVSADLQRLSARLVQVREHEQRRIARELRQENRRTLDRLHAQTPNFFR